MTAAPRTAAEASGWRRTSTHREVLESLEALDALPGGGRLALLSEAYSYLDLETRVAVTRAFALESLAADRRLADGAGPGRFGYASLLIAPVEGEILVGSVEEVELPGGPGVRCIARPELHPERMDVQVALEPTEWIHLPASWALVDPTETVRATLRHHGLGRSAALPGPSRAPAARRLEDRGARATAWGLDRPFPPAPRPPRRPGLRFEVVPGRQRVLARGLEELGGGRVPRAGAPRYRGARGRAGRAPIARRMAARGDRIVSGAAGSRSTP